MKINQRTSPVDLSNTFGFTAVDPTLQFSPLLVNVNLNIELNSSCTAMEQLITLPNSMNLAEHLNEALSALYFANSYIEKTIINNAIIQTLLIVKYN